MQPRSALCALLVLATAVAAPAGAAAAPRDRCHSAGVRTVALTDQVRVYADRDSGYYYSCVRSSGRRTLLWEQDDLYVSGVVRAVAGRFVAYTVGTSPGCKADCPPDVHGTLITSVTDAVTGRTRNLRDGLVWSVKLARSGTVAWAADDTLSLWPTGTRIEILGSGHLTDVRVSGGRLRWSDDTGRHSTAFA